MAEYKDFKPYTDGIGSIFQGLTNRLIMKRQNQERETQRTHELQLEAIRAQNENLQKEMEHKRRLQLEGVKNKNQSTPKDLKAEELGLAKQRARVAALSQKTPFSSIQGVGEIKDLLDSLSGSKDRDFQSLSTDAISYLTPVFNAKSDQDIINLDDEAKASMLETIHVLKNNNILDQYNTQTIEKLLTTAKPKPQERKKGLIENTGDFLGGVWTGITGAVKANKQPKDYYNRE